MRNNGLALFRMKVVPAVVMLLFLMTSCDDFSAPPPNDVIIYTDIKDTLVQSVRYYYEDFVNFPCDSGTMPRDSSCFINLDLDNDGQDDFAFISTHKHIDCAQCPNIRSSENSLNALHNKASLALKSSNRIFVKEFAPGDSIDYYEFWSGSRIVLSATGLCNSNDFTFNDKLFGVKLNGKVGWLHMARNSRNGLIVSEWAFNRDEFKGIVASMRE